MVRIVLFIITNLSVMILFGSILSLLGFWSSTTLGLVRMAGIFGFGGAIISLFLSKFVALSAVDGVIINKASNDMENWLLEIIHKQANKLDIVAPQLAVYDSMDMNAFATGARRNAALIAVSTGLLKNMNQESIEAVIAHEMNHVASGDMITMTLIQGVVNTFVIFISRSLAKLISYWTSFMQDQDNEQFNTNDNQYGDVNSSLTYVIVSTLLEVLFGMFASVIVFWFSRHREFYADAGSAKLVGCRNMISALQELKCSYESKNNTNSIIATLYINSVKKNSVISDLFASHPSIDKRIEALQRGTYLNKSSYFF
ncbi:protease HtpX [Blochmannia endosymbiont of Camponotus sp.]|uniref:protease HtpX n=1 Tax=Blochmannia endosymbiont of Camponotus sp. TaxID=700220 RepID=UPI002024F6AF|nr:protease HtpX [Blochmannia endosymbiont of Camponotus sp.]URJ31163.1 protease HtpX [Blochmannia endosymbiont of Camponotus sp.]